MVDGSQRIETQRREIEKTYTPILGQIEGQELATHIKHFEIDGQTWHKIPVGWPHIQFQMLVPSLEEETMFQVCATLCSIFGIPEVEA